MGEEIIFEHGIILVNEYNDNLKTRVNKLLEVEEFESFYNSPVKFSENLTVEGFMEALRPFYDKIDQHFIAFTGGFKLQKFYEQMILPAEGWENEERDKDEISHVELHWHAEVFEWDDDVNSKHYSDFSYRGDYSGIPKEKDGPYFSFSLSPMNNWKHYNFRLNEEIKCYHFGSDVDRTEDGEMKVLFTSRKSWTLFDVIKFFFSELTFHGYPESTQEIRESMEEFSKSIEETLERGEEIEGVSMDEFMLGIYEDDLKEAEKIENYEGMKKIQEKIDKLKKKIQDESESDRPD